MPVDHTHGVLDTPHMDRGADDLRATSRARKPPRACPTCGTHHSYDGRCAFEAPAPAAPVAAGNAAVVRPSRLPVGRYEPGSAEPRSRVVDVHAETMRPAAPGGQLP